MWDVYIEKKAVKVLGKAPLEIREKFEKWKDVVHQQGPEGLRNIKGFRDHALQGEWQGARSSRLNDQWRVIYYIAADEVRILVMEVTPHDYREKS